MRPPRRLLAALSVAVVLLAGCGTGGAQPQGSQAGLQLSGTVNGRQVAVSDGSPRVVVGDCGRADAANTDICIISHTVGGRLVVLVLKNPDALEAGEQLDVADVDCQQPSVCDEVSDVAVVGLQVHDDRQRARDGTVRMTQVHEHRRYAGSVRLRFGDGQVSGRFDVMPTPE